MPKSQGGGGKSWERNPFRGGRLDGFFRGLNVADRVKVARGSQTEGGGYSNKGQNTGRVYLKSGAVLDEKLIVAAYTDCNRAFPAGGIKMSVYSPAIICGGYSGGYSADAALTIARQLAVFKDL